LARSVIVSHRPQIASFSHVEDAEFDEEDVMTRVVTLVYFVLSLFGPTPAPSGASVALRAGDAAAVAPVHKKNAIEGSIVTKRMTPCAR
jgi:hypothetical protein